MNIPANPLATIVLKRAQTQDPQMWSWHEAARFGEMGAARKSCSLVMFDADGKPVARYHLENAWPCKIELGALRAGSSKCSPKRSPSCVIICNGWRREHADARPHAGGRSLPERPSLSTEFPFSLPRGYVDGRGQLHRDGVMRLATAGDEIWPQTDPRVPREPGVPRGVVADENGDPPGFAARGRQPRHREPVRLRSRLPAGPLSPHQPRWRDAGRRDMSQVRARIRC